MWYNIRVNRKRDKPTANRLVSVQEQPTLVREPYISNYNIDSSYTQVSLFLTCYFYFKEDEDMFYEVDGKPDKPRWFKLPVDEVCDAFGDMKNVSDVREILDIYDDNGQDFFREVGILFVNTIMYHCDRDNIDYFKMDKEFNLLFRKIKKNGVDVAYKSWETKKSNLQGKKEE